MNVNSLMLQRLMKGVLSIFTPCLLGGCAFSLSPMPGLIYTGVQTPVTYRNGADNRAYEILGVVEGKATATSILGIVATGDASVQNAYRAALAQQPGAEGLVEVCIDQTHTSFLGLFASNTTTLRAKAVKWVAYTAFKEPISQLDISQSFSQPTPRQQQNMLLPLLEGEPAHSPSLAYANLSGDGGGGIRLGYALRRRGTKLAFTPAISYGVSTTEETFSYTDYDYFTRRYVTRQGKTKNHLRLIPVDLNVTANFASFPQFQADLPEGLNPYAEAGLTYLVWSAKAEINSPVDSYKTDEDWDFFEIGLNLGLGAEYFVRSNLSLWGGLKRYIIIGKELDFWNWQVGVSFYPRR
ncbi:MAG: TRL domain-containing protein [Candidatus Nitrosotenuis sp.]